MSVEFVRVPDENIGYLAFGWLTMGQLLSLPLTIITLGLFLLVVNALMLMLTGWITTTFQPFGAEYVVSGFWAAFFGAIVVGLVNWVFGMLLPTRARD